MGSVARIASSSGRVRRNSSEKMSSSSSRPARALRLALAVLARLDAQQLLAVVPLVERLGLVEPLVALEPDEAGAGQVGHRLRQLRLARAGRPLDEDRLAQPVGQVDDAADRVVGQVAHLGQADPHRIEGLEARGARSRAAPAGRSSSSPRSRPHLPVAAYDPLQRRQLLHSHGAARVQLLRGDAHLRAQPQLFAVDEPRRRVHQHRRPVDLRHEAVRRRHVGGDDRLGVPRAVARRCARWRRRRRPPSRWRPPGPGTRSRSPPRWPAGRRGRGPGPARRPGSRRRRRSARPARRGRNSAATRSCTRIVSTALQTPKRCVLAFTARSCAMARSAAPSM